MDIFLRTFLKIVNIVIIPGGHSLRQDMTIMSITHTLSTKMIIGIGRLMWLGVREDDK